MARPSKLTPETQKRICDAIRLGAKYKIAAAYASVSYDAFNEWMNKGEQATSGAYHQFRHAVKEAEGAAAVGWLAKIEKAASDGTWQAAAWKLERIYPDDYALTQKHRHGGDPDNPTPIATESRVTIFIPDNGRGAADGDDDPADPAEDDAAE